MAPALARLIVSTRPCGWETLRPEIGHRRRQPDNGVVWACADPAGADQHRAVGPGFNRSASGFGSFHLTRSRRTAIPRSAVRQRWATLSLQVLGACSQFAGQRLGTGAHGAAQPGADHSHPSQQGNKMRLRTGTRTQPIACRCARWKECWRQRAPSRTVGHGSHGSTISHSKAVKISVFTELKTHKYRFLRSPCLAWTAPPKPVVATFARQHSSGVTVKHQVETEGCTRTKSRPAVLSIFW